MLLEDLIGILGLLHQRLSRYSFHAVIHSFSKDFPKISFCYLFCSFLANIFALILFECISFI